MCAIIGSFNKNIFRKLVKLNSSRGNFSYSLMCFNYKTLKVDKLIRNFHKFNFNLLPLGKNTHYYVGHIQSPTNKLVFKRNRIHPVKIKNNYLYHNGILKNNQIKNFNKLYNQQISWDSKLLLLHILKSNNLVNALDTVDGSFACILLQNINMHIFRNSSSILFYDINLNISSTKFENSQELQFNKIFKFDFKYRKLKEINQFNNINNPYFFY